ncbi:AAA family ATPase, partial [Erysipelothrix rhusiopathiae]|uniref:ATP-dependent nuclease n=1 Tax=Erysipelothrix rhusiopathiae TaxID=1648 RepID=UPI001EDF8FC0
NWESQEFTDINRRLPKNLSKCISSFYLDSSRDIVDELRIRNSNFSKLMKNSNYNLNELDSSNIERALEIVNRMIRKKLPSISEIEDNLSDISTTIENIDELRIIPIPNKFDDLDKGVEIEVKNSNNNLPISVFGDGTRSWVSILTLSSYIESTRKQLELENLPYFPIVLLEEPESHLHPQAQNKVVSQLDKISAQIFITTHSSNIVSELGIYQLFRVSNDESTQLQTVNKDISQTDRYKIMNFILPFYTEILFSNIVILVEG